MDTINSTTKRPKGQHLTYEDRVKIQAFQRAGWTQKAIADEIGCSPSTISRELRNNTPKKTSPKGRPCLYIGGRAQRMSEERRRNARHYTTPERCADFIHWMIDTVLEKGWSIDACVGCAKKITYFRKTRFPAQPVFTG